MKVERCEFFRNEGCGFFWEWREVCGERKNFGTKPFQLLKYLALLRKACWVLVRYILGSTGTFFWVTDSFWVTVTTSLTNFCHLLFSQNTLTAQFAGLLPTTVYTYCIVWATYCHLLTIGWFFCDVALFQSWKKQSFKITEVISWRSLITRWRTELNVLFIWAVI